MKSQEGVLNVCKMPSAGAMQLWEAAGDSTCSVLLPSVIQCNLVRGRL